MKLKKPLFPIILLVLFAVCLLWTLFHIRIYLPGSVIAEVVYADKNGLNGHDSLKYEDENGNRIDFNYMYKGDKSTLSSGARILVGGEIVDYNEDYSGEANRSLTIVPLWLGYGMPIVTVLFAVSAFVSGKAYLKQKKLRNLIYTQTSLNYQDNFYDTIAALQHQNSNNIAKVAFLKEKFVGSDYGTNKGLPTRYYINDVEITDLLGEERVVKLPYGIYKIKVLGYRTRLKSHAGGGQTFAGGYIPSNTLELILNEDHPSAKIKVGRAIDSGEGRHLSVQ